ncbi:MAG TPA: phosphodiester glycosidase family protein [Acidimicrobiales bacterium]|nr:phosphodiester glycosidase family protein [Acidimicrobiales bacterium]
MSASQVPRRLSRLSFVSLCLASALGLFAVLGVPVAASQVAPGGLPEPLQVPVGWGVVSSQSLGRGADHFVLSRASGPVVAHVVRAARGDLALRAVVSHDRISGPSEAGERTSAMCARVGCVAAVNADFARLGSDQPVGAVVSGGRVLRSPVGTHHQFSVGWGPLMASGLLEWRARLMSSDLREIPVTGLNDPNLTDGAVLFTPAWGAAVARGPEHTSLLLRFVGGVGELVPATTEAVEIIDLSTGPGEIALTPGTAVLRASGDSATALRDLWDRASTGAASRRALIRIDLGPDARESVGGTPVLVRDGRAWVQDDGTGFVSGRHPRTVAGWDAAGRVLLVTVDGRQPGHSIGMTLPELGEFLVGLGAVEALNLDGGGSTTMVIAGQVVNLPSDRLIRRGGVERVEHELSLGDELIGNVERPISVGLVLVPSQPAAETRMVAPQRDPLAPEALALPVSRDLHIALPSGDPGSDPHAGSAPALIAATMPGESDGLSAAWVAVAVLLQVLLATAVVGPTIAGDGRADNRGRGAARGAVGAPVAD